MSLLSVIVPCYNEEESVELFHSELMKNEAFFREKDVEIELLYINDGSKDHTEAAREGFQSAFSILFQKFWQGGSHVCWSAES